MGVLMIILSLAAAGVVADYIVENDLLTAPNHAIALFGSPAMIAIPARFNVVTTQLFQFFGNPVRVEVAAAYAGVAP